MGSNQSNEEYVRDIAGYGGQGGYAWWEEYKGRAITSVDLWLITNGLDAAIQGFEEDRSRLMALRAAKVKKGPRDPFGVNYDYISWLPGRHDITPPVLHSVNPALYRVDREYSNKPPYMHAYDRKLYRRMPNVFASDSNYSTTTYTPPDHSMAHIDPERTPADLDALNKCRRSYMTGQNAWGEDTDPMDLPTPPHNDPDPHKVHILDEHGFFRPRRPEPYYNQPYFP